MSDTLDAFRRRITSIRLGPEEDTHRAQEEAEQAQQLLDDIILMPKHQLIETAKGLDPAAAAMRTTSLGRMTRVQLVKLIREQVSSKGTT